MIGYSEADLEAWLFDHPEEFEQGLRWVKRQYPISWRGYNLGKIDLLGVDKNGKMVVVELKSGALNHRDYSQGLSYYRTITTHHQKEARLCFVGPTIGTRFRIVHELLQETSTLDVQIKLFDFDNPNFVLRDYDPEIEGRIVLQVED